MDYIKYNGKLIIAWVLLAFAMIACNEEPYMVGYEGFTCTSDSKDYVFPSGSTGSVEAKVVAEKGLKAVKVKINPWSAGGVGSEEVMQVKGSPKTYDLIYSFIIPDDADEDNEITFTLEDYSGATIEYKVNVTTLLDEIPPVVVVTKPIAPDNKYSPVEKVPFIIRVTDDKKIKEAILSCEALAYNRKFLPAEEGAEVIEINEAINIPEEGNYTFRLSAYDAQGNVTEEAIDFTISVGSKPAVVNLKTGTLTGVAGGKLPFGFRISTDGEHTITKVEVRITSDDAATVKSYTPGQQIYELNDALDIPITADAHVNDLKLEVIATNNIDETTAYSENCSIIKNVYIFGKGIVSKEHMEYSMMMEHQAGTNDFTYKTYIEDESEGFRFWTGSISVDAASKERVAKPTTSWGKKETGTVEENSPAYIMTAGKGYYVVTFDPVALVYTVAVDENVPLSATYPQVYSQVNNLLYRSGIDWVAANWNFILLNPFPGNVHRFYIDVKTNSAGNDWEQAFFGLAAQPGDKGTMFSVPPGGGYTYGFNGFASNLQKETDWGASGKLSEKGTCLKGTKFRLVVDTYLMQLGWMPIENYTYPSATQ